MIGSSSVGPVRGIVLEVGVLHDHHIAGARRERGANRGAFAAIEIVKDEFIDAAGVFHSLEHLARTVGREIVDTDDFLANGNRVNLIQNHSIVARSLYTGMSTESTSAAGSIGVLPRRRGRESMALVGVKRAAEVICDG